MSKGIFITATGTDVGKTYITGLITKKLRENGINAGYYKAALSGSEIINGKQTAGDARFVCEISGIQEKPEDLISYIYKTSVSPHLAAQIENNPVETDLIVSDFNRMKKKFDFITAEGSGGIICPLRMDDKVIMLTDVINLLKLDVIIVAQAALGTINSTVLTVKYAQSSGICVKGIILNHYDNKSFLHSDNKKTIEKLSNIPVIACVSENSRELNIDIDKLIDLYEEI